MVKFKPLVDTTFLRLMSVLGKGDNPENPKNSCHPICLLETIKYTNSSITFGVGRGPQGWGVWAEFGGLMLENIGPAAGAIRKSNFTIILPNQGGQY